MFDRTERNDIESVLIAATDRAEYDAWLAGLDVCDLCGEPCEVCDDRLISVCEVCLDRAGE